MPPPSCIAPFTTHTAPLSLDTRKNYPEIPSRDLSSSRVLCQRLALDWTGDRLPLTPMRSGYGLRICHDFVFPRICSLIYVRLASLLYHIQVEPDHMPRPPLRVWLLHGTLYFNRL